MNRQPRKRTAMNLCQMGVVIMCLAWPLVENSHPAVQLALTLLGALVAGWGVVLLARLVSEQEKHIQELQNQLKPPESSEPRYCGLHSQ